MGNTLPARPRGWLWLLVAVAIVVVCAAAAVTAWAQGVRGWPLLMWSGVAGAVVFAAGLVVPWAVSRRDRLAGQRVAALEEAARVEAEIRAVMRPLSAPESWGGGAVGEGSPAALLRGDRQVVGFTGRRDELRGLGSWARGSARGMVRLVTGPGGSGKTRLAVEFASRLKADGWRCGFLQDGHGAQAVAAIAAAGDPALLVVDYAEARADLVPLLTALADHDQEPVIRVLLLARSLGAWWQPDGPLRRHAAVRDALAGAEAVPLGPLSLVPRRHQEVFAAALEAFAGHYGIGVPAAGLRPVQGDVPVLLLHAAALTAVLDAREGIRSAQVSATAEVVDELLGHEAKYWADTALAHGLDGLGVGGGIYRQLVAIAGLLGAGDEAEARQVLRRLPDLAGAPELTVGVVAGWLRDLYPTASSSWIGPIQPDLLLEYLVTSVFGQPGRLADAALTGLPENRANQALTVLAQALDHYPAVAAGLLRRLLAAHADALALPAVRLARNLDSAALGQILAAVLADTPVSAEVLAALAADLRQTSLPLVPVTIAAHLKLGADMVARGQMADAAEIAAMMADVAAQLRELGFLAVGAEARWAVIILYRALEQADPGRYRADLALALSNLGVTLNSLGREREAHPALVEAVELYRALEQADPGRYRPYLVPSLSNLGVTLSHLGREREAHPALVEAVELYRAMEQAEPGRHRAGLALALVNLGTTLSGLGQDREAHPVLVEAVELYWALEQAEPGRYHADLALALSNLGATLKDLGQDREAHPIEADAVKLYRALEQADPGRYRPYLAPSLSNLGITLSSLGREREAHPALVEAVELYRALEQAEPGRYHAYLARSLINLGITLKRLGREREAHPVLVEAVELYRALEQAEPGRYHAYLALALSNLGITLSGLGREREAHPVLVEAVELYRALEQAEPGRYHADLALALVNLGVTLNSLGREREAHPVLVEAVELYRALEQAEPGRYHADLAATLATLGATLSRLGRHDVALTVTTEATGLYRALVEKDPAGYRSRLAHTLAALSGIQLDLGHLDEAQDARNEADLHGSSS